MAIKTNLKPQNPLILKSQRLMEAFAKSDDERDFYLDRLEGFIIYADQDKSSHDLEMLEKELKTHADRYCLIPKLTFYETKKIMEGFVNEKVYDIDTKEKLLDIIQSKEARENFLEFIYDHHAELEKWQQYYQERSRIRIIEWLRSNHFTFCFEEDLEIPKAVIEKVKRDHFEPRPSKEVLAARRAIELKSKSYYSSEALNPSPKRGRPPKQIIKSDIEPLTSKDIYSSVPPEAQLFLFTPDHASTSIIAFSSKFDNEEQMLASRKSHAAQPHMTLESLNQKLAALRNLSSRWLEHENKPETAEEPGEHKEEDEEEYSELEDEIEIEEEEELEESKPKVVPKPKKIEKKAAKKSEPLRKPPIKKPPVKKPPPPPPQKPPLKKVVKKPSKVKYTPPPKKIVSKKKGPPKPLPKTTAEKKVKK